MMIYPDQVTGKQFSGTNPLPVMIEKLKATSNYDQRKADIEKFNQVNFSSSNFNLKNLN